MAIRKKPHMRGEPFSKNFPYALRFVACIMWCGAGLGANTVEGLVSAWASLLFLIALLIEVACTEKGTCEKK